MKKIISFLSLSFLLLIRDLKERYIGTYMGILWGLVQPGVTLMVMWVVFSVGFKIMPGAEYPFMVWLIPGYIVWQYMSEGIISGTSSIIERGYLVKQMVFQVEVLPVVKIMSALVVHMIFIVVMLVVVWGGGYGPRLSNIQLIYYLICGTGIAYGVSMLSSSVAVFSRDVVQVVNMLMQLGFWGTPIFWDAGILPAGYGWIVEINPVAYVVEGYRRSMLGGEYFWEQPYEMMRYWMIMLVMIKVGRSVFRRMRVHFADVL